MKALNSTTDLKTISRSESVAPNEKSFLRHIKAVVQTIKECQKVWPKSEGQKLL
jgi:hypothetical protein